jgi:hypothetical protein
MKNIQLLLEFKIATQGFTDLFSLTLMAITKDELSQAREIRIGENRNA